MFVKWQLIEKNRDVSVDLGRQVPLLRVDLSIPIRTEVRLHVDEEVNLRVLVICRSAFAGLLRCCLPAAALKMLPWLRHWSL